MTKKLTPALISSHLKTIVLGCWGRFHIVFYSQRLKIALTLCYMGGKIIKKHDD